MDARLGRINGQRPYFLRSEDVPVLARAIVGYSLKRVRVRTDFRGSVGVVILEGFGLNLVVRKEDWDKITPWIKDPTFYPSAKGYTRSTKLPDGPEESVEPELYKRVFDRLMLIFPDSFPSAK